MEKLSAFVFRVVQAVLNYNIGLKIEAVSISETLVPQYQSTTRHIPEDWIFINTSVKTPILYWNITFKAIRMFLTMQFFLQQF